MLASGAIEAGLLVPPLHVTHVDAHADLGMGDSGHVHLMELLQLPPDRRTRPRVADTGDWGDLQEGNYLLYSPPEADELYEAIRREFIDEERWPPARNGS